ncbi:ComEA family DNA-binding protein [Teredinibacter sp. KSP-S5-2]|nr:ComEA family DNA-binding protein [Teredinibacter sp. KSP-S5-2]
MAAGKPKSSSPAEISIQKVSINKADAETLAASLKGIGLKKAQAIVEWREANGKFTSIDQLTEVKGIGESTIKKNRALITL